MSKPIGRGVVRASSLQLVLDGTKPLVGAIDQLLGIVNGTAFALLDHHARQVIICQCSGCTRGRELAANVANIIIENAACGLWPADLIATAKSFNRGKPVDDPKIELAHG